MASSTTAWTVYLWRFIVSMLAPSSILLYLGVWAVSSVWGSPVPVPELPPSWRQSQKQLHRLGKESAVYWDASEFNCFNANLPNITIYATGGTIAGSASSADQTTGYQAGALGIQSLIDAVPQLCNVCNVRGVQVVNSDSTNMNSSVLLGLSQQIQEELESPYMQGAVVTHGTDTLEESAFFLDLTLNTDKPVVVTGAMRPATAISADGPMNLLSSATLASNENARGRGVMIVLNDRIGSARFMAKSNANQLDAFQSADGGLLGTFVNIQPVFFYPPSRPLGHHYFDVRQVRRWRGQKLPQVDVFYAQQELNVGLIQAAIDLGTRGIVLAGFGSGYWTEAGADEINRVLQETDIPVIMSRRPGWGFASSNGIDGIGAGFLNPQKARIQLQLALEMGLETDAIRAIFEYQAVNVH